MTGQIVSRFRQALARGLQTRIGTQVVAIIGIFVATRNLEDTLLDEVGIGMVDIALMATIR